MVIEASAWKKLAQDSQRISQTTLAGFFSRQPSRGQSYATDAAGLWLNYSRNHLDDEVLSNLTLLAEHVGLNDKIDALFSGEAINQSESRAALHPLLRAPLDEANLRSVDVHLERDKMVELSNRLERDELIAEQTVLDVVCIGIGGSELGPRLIYEALGDIMPARVRLHFLANIDGAAAKAVIRRVDKNRTIFIVTSKSFRTLETKLNFETIKKWFCRDFSEQEFYARSYAVTAEPDAAYAEGFLRGHVFRFWDWVGGRFSLWSTVGLPIVLAFGTDVFDAVLAGAHRMDTHFRDSDFTENMPVLLGLIHTWNSSFLGHQTRAVIPYSQVLSRFPSFLQQLEMESLGKSVDVNGQSVSYSTSPVVWGSAGSNGQHAFFQLLHQGSQVVPVDFIAAVDAGHPFDGHHRALLANCLAQSESLMTGGDIGRAEHGRFAGNRPSNFILMDKIDAACIGALIALYEHKVYVQSVLWDINAFDQWGVELGKSLAKKIMSEQTQQMLTKANIKQHFHHKAKP